MSEGFDSFLAPVKEKSAIDVLNELINENKLDFISILSMRQIRFICKAFAYKLHYEKPNLSTDEIIDLMLILYKALRVSYKGKRAEQLIQGLSELKDEFLKHELEKEMNDRK